MIYKLIEVEKLAVNDTVFVIILSGFVCLFVAMLTYFYGKIKGAEEQLKQPNMIYPSLLDVTILGKYLIQNQSSEQIVNALEDWLTVNGYKQLHFANMIKIVHVREPPQVAKKKDYFAKLSLMRDGIPQTMFLNLHSSDIGAQLLEVEAVCLPRMHDKLGQYVQFSFPKSSVEDAQRLCKDFMANTMCILNAKVLIAPYVESSSAPSKNLELLLNTPSQSNVNKKAHEIVADAKIRIQLIGWIDREFLGDLESAHARGVEVKVITKSPDSSDKTVKEDFERLLKVVGKTNVRINPRSHDRFLMCDNTAIIGSMYYTSSSKTRYESAIHTSNESIINGLTNHFKEIWGDKDSKIPQ